MFLENNRSRIEKQFETFCQKLPGIAAHISKRMDALNPDVILALKYLYVCPIAMQAIILLIPFWILPGRGFIFGKTLHIGPSFPKSCI